MTVAPDSRPQAEADPDTALVEGARAGDTAAFGELVSRHQRRVVAHLRRLVGEHDALDLGQETFVRAWGRLALYDPAFRFIGWLLVIATRLALNHRRKLRQELPALEDCDLLPVGGPTPQELHDRREEARHQLARLEAILDRLGPQARMLYELRFRQELGLDELACHFGVSEGAIKVRVHRLRQSLITAMEEPHGPR